MTTPRNTFDEAKFPSSNLDELEFFWRDHQKWLEKCGYKLRPRYKPDWQPSWLAIDEQGKTIELKQWYQCEDSLMHIVCFRYLLRLPGLTLKVQLLGTISDATRISDGQQVSLKCIKPSRHPYEAEIGTFLSSQPLASDTKNHCVPIYDVLQVPDMDDRTILVMPLLRWYDDPPFQTVGETIDFFGQIFDVSDRNHVSGVLLTTTIKGLKFMHDHHVAHR
jgi:serine/threonine protein kinase